MPIVFSPELAADRERFGARLRALREKAGLTHEELAERVGLDRKSISRTENARHSPALDVIFALAQALKVRPIELFRW